MNEYKRPYLLLFNGISDTVKALEDAALLMEEPSHRERIETAILSLRTLQQDAENLFVEEKL